MTTDRGSIEEQLTRLAELTDGWDSYSAAAPTPAALDVVRRMQVTPSANGGVQVEWHCGGWDIEVEFDERGEYEGSFICRSLTASKASPQP